MWRFLFSCFSEKNEVHNNHSFLSLKLLKTLLHNSNHTELFSKLQRTCHFILKVYQSVLVIFLVPFHDLLIQPIIPLDLISFGQSQLNSSFQVLNIFFMSRLRYLLEGFVLNNFNHEIFIIIISSFFV